MLPFLTVWLHMNVIDFIAYASIYMCKPFGLLDERGEPGYPGPMRIENITFFNCMCMRML